MCTTANSQSDVDEVVRRIFAKTEKFQQEQDFSRTLQVGWFESPIGVILAAGDDEHLHFLTFMDVASLERKAALIQKKLQARLDIGDSATVKSVTEELRQYFLGNLQNFTTPIALSGTSFQLRVWEELSKVPYGETVTYTELARRIDRPNAFRAVAQANSQNPVSIVVPCHRVINGDGALGGYNAGVERKKWLLEFEQSVLLRDDE